jgi:hypothetical protein
MTEQQTIDGMAKTMWLSVFERAFSRTPTDPWENQADEIKDGYRNTARKLIDAGYCAPADEIASLETALATYRDTNRVLREELKFISARMIEACAKVAEAVQLRMKEECDFGAGIAAREIRSLSQAPVTDAAVRREQIAERIANWSGNTLDDDGVGTHIAEHDKEKYRKRADQIIAALTVGVA